MSEIRVILSEMPPLLRDILHDALRDEPMMRIVGEIARHADREAAVMRLGADVLVTGEPQGADRATCRLLVVRRPGAGSGQSVSDGIRLDETPLGDVSPSELVEAIRQAVAARTEENPWRHS